jgi:hypothetical protein
MAGKQSSTKSSKSRLADLIDRPADLEELKVFIVSWNMGNAEPEGLMNVFDEKNARDSYDIFVIGLQKSTYYNPDTHESIHHFQNYIRSQFPDAQYEVVRSTAILSHLLIALPVSLGGALLSCTIAIICYRKEEISWKNFEH